MKKLCIFLAFLLTLSACSSGCYIQKQKYSQEDADAVSEKGTAMMQLWLDENMPDAVLDECEAYIASAAYNRVLYLTDYASGYITHNGSKKEFTINTVTGAVYFQPDDDTKRQLRETVEAYFYEAIGSIGIIPESLENDHVFECFVMAPVADGNSTVKIPGVYWFDFGLPAGIKDLNEYVLTDPQSRLPIFADPPVITVSEKTDLYGYDLAAIQEMEAEYGLFINDFKLVCGSKTFNKSLHHESCKTDMYDYGTWYEGDGFKLHGITYWKTELLDIETDELTVSEFKFDPETDIMFEQTNDGYRWNFMNEDIPSGYGFTLLAYEGSEILNYDYYNIPADGKPDDGRKTVWIERDGYYVLASGRNNQALTLFDGEKLVRIE